MLIITCCVQKVVLQTKSCYENRKLIFGGDGTPYVTSPSQGLSSTRGKSLGTRLRFPSPLLILLLFPVNINECRVLQVSLVLRFKFKTDLIINWIYPIKTHGERLGASLIVYKSEAGSHRPPPDSGAPLLYRSVLQTVVFRVFCLGYVCDRANFTITKIEAYKKNFEQNIWSIMAL